MNKLKKISYEDDFSDSNSTIDYDLDTISFTNTAQDAVFKDNEASTSKSNNYLLPKFVNHDDDELESILKKYGNPSAKSSPPVTVTVQTTSQRIDTIELSSDDDDNALKLPEFSLKGSIETNKCDSLNLNSGSSKILPDYNMELNDDDSPESLKSKKQNTQLNADKEAKKREKAKKQEEAARQKQIKQALLAANRNMKPENCMKFITVTLDNNIVNEKYGGEVLNALQALEVTYKLESQLIPNTVTWTRKNLQYTTDANEFTESSEDIEVDEALIIMSWREVINLVDEETLLSHIDSVKSILNKRKLFILIYEMENYFKNHKRQKTKVLKNSATQQTSHKSYSKTDKTYEGVPKIEKKQLETSLTELQIMHSSCHQFIETPQHMGEMVAHFTKSVALVPYKTKKYEEQQQANLFLLGDNRDCVKVDKNGNGIRRLWQQQLTTFPLARLELAEAIVTKYPTLRSLLEECNKSEHGEKLLQDMPIRRAAGPLTTVRKIGPELSKKIYTYFTSTEGELPI